MSPDLIERVREHVELCKWMGSYGVTAQLLGECLEALEGQGWVSASERLPEKCGHNDHSRCVLIYCPHNECQYAATYNHKNGRWEKWAGLNEVIWHHVPSWREMPSPPTDTGNS